MKQKQTIPTILGIIILVISSFAGVILIKNSQIFRIGAEVGSEVKNIRATNISDNSVTITWTTDIATTSFLLWGDSENTSNIEDEDREDQKYFNHSVTLTGLSQSTKYFYKINSNGVTFDNSGIPWSVTTGPTLSSNRNSQLLSGNIVNSSGTPTKHALVYADISGYILSTLTSDTGNFVFQVASARTSNLRNYANVNPAQTLIKLSVQTAPEGSANASIFLQSANPLPPMTLGQTYDFRNNPINNLGSNPNADLNLPLDTEPKSKFNITLSNETPRPTSVILESINEGEIITSTQPEFFGKAPEGTSLSITVNSEETINGQVTVPAGGSWSYEVPTNLSPGAHSITVSWVDLSGITRFLTRNFVVQAAEAPAFTASESGNTASPSPTLVPQTTLSPTPISTKSPSPTPLKTPIASATVVPVPVSGELTPSILLFIMGVAVVSFSIVVWKISEN